MQICGPTRVWRRGSIQFVGTDFFYIGPNWEEATRSLPRRAEALLLELAGLAAANQSTTLSVDYEFLESLREDPVDRHCVHLSFQALVQGKFVRQVEDGRYLIAPGLWALAADMLNIRAQCDPLAAMAEKRDRKD
jgi:hypothetical protein